MPADQTVIVRDIVLLATAAGQVNIYVSNSSGLNYQLLWLNLTAETFHHLEIRQALEPGDEIHVYHSDQHSTNVAITGYVFGPAG